MLAFPYHKWLRGIQIITRGNLTASGNADVNVSWLARIQMFATLRKALEPTRCDTVFVSHCGHLKERFGLGWEVWDLPECFEFQLERQRMYTGIVAGMAFGISQNR